ncbi:MAG: chemotaxis-specific protein-glutamate methyltransferase CheB [Bacteriovoracaceae bacterium]
MKILVVDDSVVFRTQISASLKDVKEVEVVGTAANGRIALQKLEQMNIDLITLDMEMPELNGIETIKAIKEKGLKTKIIVFSSQTPRGATAALEALRLGADDVVAKPSNDVISFEHAQKMIREALIPSVLQFIMNNPYHSLERVSQKESVQNEARNKINLKTFSPKAVVIASSTGGPNALENIFSKLKGPFRYPVFITQHMPPVFTKILADRLSDICGVVVKEAVDGEKALENTVYIAPGDFHMSLKLKSGVVYLSLDQTEQRNSVRPAADNLFETAADIYQDKLLGVVLTGMGEDGVVGATRIKKNKGAVLIQSKETCVVFGMPGAVFERNDYDEIMDLEKIGLYLKDVLK